jgi:3-hydroxybutyryl-CoA dehydrogenase
MSGVIGVVGGGRMGAGIAQAFATIGYDVVVAESSEKTASEARMRISNGLQRAVEHGASEIQSDLVAARTRFITGIAELPNDTELVVEAVPETMALKHEVLRSIEDAVSATCVITTNTSSLSISQLADIFERPQRFAGMHFFNPVPSSLLVEVVVGEQTLSEIVSQITAWVEELGKSAIIVRDSPGFATSRLGVLLGLEAIRMLEEGVASAQDIDRAMELGYRHPMGPLRSSDLVGLDIRLAIAEYLSGTLGERFNPPQLLREKVRLGELGRKTGKGFFRWD